MLRKLLCLLFVGLVCLPNWIAAQDQIELTQTFEYDGSLTFQYPTDWSASFWYSEYTHIYFLYNSIEAHAAYSQGGYEALEDGQLVIQIFPNWDFEETVIRPEAKPVELLTLLLFNEVRRGSLSDPKISLIKIDGRPAASAVFTPRTAGQHGSAIMFELENGDPIVIFVVGKGDEVENVDETLLAIIATITPHIYEPLELTQTYEDKLISFDYPEGWFDCPCSPNEPVKFLSSIERDWGADFDPINGGIMVLIFKDVEAVFTGMGHEWTDNLTPAEIIAAYFGGNPDNILEYDSNGRTTARVRVGSTGAFTPHNIFVIVELEEGRFGGVVAVMTATKSQFATEATVLAIVDSMTIPE